VSGQLHAPAALPPGKNPHYPLDRTLGGPQSQSGQHGEVLCIESFCPQKSNRTMLFGSYTQARSPFGLLKSAFEVTLHVCFLDCHEAGLCCYLVIHIENYYIHHNCFTSICDLFTDSPSYSSQIVSRRMLIWEFYLVLVCETLCAKFDCTFQLHPVFHGVWSAGKSPVLQFMESFFQLEPFNKLLVLLLE
jgi:hypothetical protein